jgi:hypothetical protein
MGANKRLSQENPKAMTLPPLNARAAKRLATVDEQARAAGQYPLPEPERQRRAQALLNAEMAQRRAAKATKAARRTAK